MGETYKSLSEFEGDVQMSIYENDGGSDRERVTHEYLVSSDSTLNFSDMGQYEDGSDGKPEFQIYLDSNYGQTGHVIVRD